MKALCFVTYTDCENKKRSLECAGFEVVAVQYDDRPHDAQQYYVDRAREIAPDFMVYIGAVEPYHGRPTLKPDILRQLRDVAPSILMCNDAADHPWWPLLETYERHECFTTMVSIDGSYNNPITNFVNGMLELTPTDVRPFADNMRIWPLKDIACGFVGGLGHGPRQQAIRNLERLNLLQFYAGPQGRTYDEFAALMCRIRVMPNFPYTGTGQHKHVKGRVIEAGFAGCCVIEHEDSPTSKWFNPSSDFLTYRTEEDLVRLITNTPSYVFEDRAHSFQRKMVDRYHPRRFWQRVLNKTGIEWVPAPISEPTRHE